MKKKMIDWYRVGRTAIQAASGAVIALIPVLVGEPSAKAAIAAGVEFLSTVIVAVAMNIRKQAKEADTYGDDCE